MSTQEYLRLDYLKQRGGDLAIGDKYLFCTCGFTVDEKLLRELSVQNEYDTDRSITHFEFRDNKGKPNLPDDFPVRVLYEDGDYSYGTVSGFCFVTSNEKMFQIVSWRPDYETLLKQQKDHDKMKETVDAFSIDTASGEALNTLANSVCIKRQYPTEDEKQMTKLTSKDIEWEDGMKYAVVHKESGTLYNQDKVAPTVGSFKGPFTLYNSGFFYIVEREQEVPVEELIYTVAMKQKGELPKSGMKCLVDEMECLYVGTNSKGEALLEFLINGAIINTELKYIEPIKTEAELKAEREEELKSKVVEVISNNSGSWLSKEYFKKHAQDLFDQGLLRDQSED